MASEWTTVSRQRKPRTCMTRTRAEEIQKRLNIRNLADALMSTESKNLQAEGWAFDTVIAPAEGEDGDTAADAYVHALGLSTTPNEYTWIPTGNKFRDIVIFSRRQ